MIRSFFDSDPPRFLEAPFSMGDEKEARALFEAAGLTNIASTIVTRSQPAAHADVARGLVTGNPTINEIRERSAVSVFRLPHDQRPGTSCALGNGGGQQPGACLV